MPEAKAPRMWNGLLESGSDQGRFLAPFSADSMDSSPSRRVSAASDDSFDASSYVHVDNKLNSKMPQCLFGCDITEKAMENHFAKAKSPPAGNSVTKSGKRVIRKRLSTSEFNARLRANFNNNSNAVSRKTGKNGDVSSSSDNDTLPKTKKRSTNVLSAKIQHLLFEMKRLRQMDRDILRQFLIINDTIEEQKWMMEEKQEAIKRSLSEEGEDPGSVMFNVVQETGEESRDDLDENVQTMLLRDDADAKVFDSKSPVKDIQNTKIARKDSDLVSTSSDSALSMTGGSSTLSSTTSLPVSNRSSSPSTSNLSTTSASSSYVDSAEAKTKEIIFTARTEPIRRVEHEFEGDDIEGYYRMNGSGVKRGSYQLPRQSQSFDYAPRGHVYDDSTLDSAYSSTRRGSTDSDSRDAADYGMSVRRGIVNRSYDQQYRADCYQGRPMRSHSVREQHDSRNRVKRVSVRPDGSYEHNYSNRNGVRRASSVNERTTFQRPLQQSVTQRQLAKFSISRQMANLSFVPIVEQEPDAMQENGRFYSPEKSARSDLPRQDVSQNIITPRASKPIGHNHLAAPIPRPTATPRRQSPLSPPRPSSSNPSVLSQRNYLLNEADQYRSYSPKSKDPVWVPQFPGSVKPNHHYGTVPNYPELLAHSYSYHRNHVDGKYPDPYYYDKPRDKYPQRTTSNRAPAYQENLDNKRMISYAPTNSKPSTQAVYQWIQTQDDITYL